MDIEKDELPQGWAWVRLEDLKSDEPNALTDGPFGSKLKSEHYVPKGVRVVRLGNIGIGQFQREDRAYITEEHFSSLRKHQIFLGDLLIAALAEPVGRCCEVPGNLGTAIVKADCIRFKPSAEVDRRFVMHWLNSPSGRETVEAMSHGVGRLRVNMKELRSIPVPLAPAVEQTRIVDKIDELFSDIDEGERGLRKVQALLKKHRQAVLKAAVTGELTRAWRDRHGPPAETGAALLTRILAARRAAWEADQRGKAKAAGKMLKGEAWKSKYEIPVAADVPPASLPESWCWTSLNQLGFVSGGITKNSKRESLPLRVPYLRVANVYAGRLNLSNVLEIGLKDEGELTRAALQPSDVLVVEGNGSLSEVGRAAVWLGEVAPCVHQNHIIRVRPVLGEMAKFLVTWMTSPPGRNLIEEKASSTSGLHTLSLSKVEHIAVPLPPLVEQAAIIDRVEEEMSKIDAMEAVVVAELRRSARLRQSILKVAFTGKLVPQNPADEPADALLARLREACAIVSKSKNLAYPPKVAASQADPFQSRRRGRPRKVASEPQP